MDDDDTDAADEIILSAPFQFPTALFCGDTTIILNVYVYIYILHFYISPK